MKKLKIKNREITRLLGAEAADFPKYATQIINLANQNAQGTRPEVVGQMSELIKEFKGQKLDEWEKWYLNRHPEAISKAANKISQMVENFRQVLPQLDAQMVEKWVKDLVVVKTFVGLKFQEAILKHVAEHLGMDCRTADPNEESKGIDGFIGNNPVSIKPHTYETKPMLPEKIGVRIIFYEKVKDGINVWFDEFDERE